MHNRMSSNYSGNEALLIGRYACHVLKLCLQTSDVVEPLASEFDFLAGERFDTERTRVLYKNSIC